MNESPEQNDDMHEECEKHSIEVRPTEPTDFPRLSEILQKAWRVAYPSEEHGITEELIHRHTAPFTDSSAAEIQREKLRDLNLRKWTATVDGQIAGFANVDLAKNEVEGMYVDPAYQNTPDRKLDVGKRRMERALDALDRKQDIILMVLSYNARAMRFYEKFGFRFNREKPDYELLDGVGMPTHEMVRPAQPE